MARLPRSLRKALRANAAAGADAFRLGRLRKALRGKLGDRSVFVLGSAPEPDLSFLDADSVVVCVNGSPRVARDLGLQDPAVTIVDYELVDPVRATEKAPRRDIVASSLLEGLNLGWLVAAQSNDAAGAVRKSCAADTSDSTRSPRARGDAWWPRSHPGAILSATSTDC